MTLQELKEKSLSELESIYQNPFPQQQPPPGIYKGTWLKRINSTGAKNPLFMVPQWFLFDVLPYGIEFTNKGGIWFFMNPALRIGRFSSNIGPSRFRNTECTRMFYNESDVPSPISRLLYDEVKVLSPSLLLGLGGMNFEKGEGDHFYFALHK